MERTTGDDSVAIKPAYTPGLGGAGYYNPATPGTVVRAEDLNLMQEELVNVAIMRGAPTDSTNDHQCKDALLPVLTLESGETDTGAAALTTPHKAFVMASEGSKSHGEWSGTIASFGSFNNSHSSLLLASTHAQMSHAWSIGGGFGVNPITDTPLANQNLTWRVDSGSGDVYCADVNYNGSLNSGSWSDFAEVMPNASPGAIPNGTILTRSGLKVRTAGAGERIAGVVSHGATFIGNAGKADPNMSGPGRHEDRINYSIVGLCGMIPVRVDATVRVDDYVIPDCGGIGTATPDAPRGRVVIECAQIVEPFDAARGYAVALCLVG